ncbi:MAG: sulfate reduction electron transfer complex DsrMKJOP subunit DsrM [Candidatus Kapaibacterium sp.]
MGIWISLLATAVLVAIGALGVYAQPVFGIVIPYIALAVFVIGLVVRIIRWARAPVPFHIPTTTGQQKSLDFIKQNKFDSPYTKFQTFIRMFLEVVTFRSLFRNTRAQLKNGEKLVYGDDKWLWLFAILFHYSFLIIVLRHFRFFTEPSPGFVETIQTLDGFLQIGLPILFITDILILAGLLYLFFRRIIDKKVKYISLSSDYFPLLLIGGIAVTGILMRYFTKVDLIDVKALAAGLFTFNPQLPAEPLGAVFYIHLFLVSALLIYFPMSKLVHAPGVFMSPTRNQPNNSRAVRHVNPWNPEVEFHTYEEYEEEFRDVMKAAGLPLEKEGDDVK